MSTETAPKIISLKDFKFKKEYNCTKEELANSRSFACKTGCNNYPIFSITLTTKDIIYIVERLGVISKMYDQEEFLIGLVYTDYFAYLYDAVTPDHERDELIEKINSMPENSILELESPWYTTSVIKENPADMIIEKDHLLWHFKEKNLWTPRLPAQMFYELYEDIQP